MRAFYPATDEAELPELLPFQSRGLAVLPGQQRDLVIRPAATRTYTLQTFGESDTVMVLFERDAGQLRYQAGDDDSGEELEQQATTAYLGGGVGSDAGRVAATIAS